MLLLERMIAALRNAKRTAVCLESFLGHRSLYTDSVHAPSPSFYDHSVEQVYTPPPSQSVLCTDLLRPQLDPRMPPLTCVLVLTKMLLLPVCAAAGGGAVASAGEPVLPARANVFAHQMRRP